MSEHRPDLRTWAAGVVFFGLAIFIGTTLPKPELKSESEPKSDTSKKIEPVIAQPEKLVSSNASENPRPAFSPPGDDEIPKNEFGDAVRLGEKSSMTRRAMPGSLSATPCNAQTVIWIPDAWPTPLRSGRPMWRTRRIARRTNM